MTPRSFRPRARSGRVLLAAAVLAGASAPASGAATVSGPTTFTFTGSALEKYKIDVVASGGKRESENSTKHVLATKSASFGRTTTKLKHQGVVTLSRKTGGKTRKLRLSGIELRLKSKGSVVSAKVGGKRMDFLELDLRKREYTATKSGAVVKVDASAGKLSKRAAASLRRALKIRSLPRSSFAVVGTTANAPDAPGVPGGSPSAPGGSGVAPAVAPAPAPPPASARTVTQVEPLRWHVRESFIRYISSGEGVSVSNGATAGAPAADGKVYDFDFTPTAGSWFDAASGTGRFLFKGDINFKFSAHGIDIALRDPELRLSGPDSMLYATYAGSAGAAELATVDLAAGTTAGTAGNSYVFGSVPVFITEKANAAAFAGFYPAPDNDFGNVNLRFTYGP